MHRSLKVIGYLFIGFLMLFILAPMIVIIPVSFSSSNMFQFPPGDFSLERYTALLQEGRIWSSLALSAVVGVCSTLIAGLIGITAGLGIVRGNLPMKSMLESLFLGPLIVPLVTLGIGMLILFRPLGLVGSPVGIILAHSIVIAPYVIRIAIASLRHLDPTLEEAAIIHGAKEGYAFRTVVLPQLIPALISGAMLALLVSFDEYTITNFLVQADVVTLPIRIYQLVSLDINPVVTSLAGMTIMLSVVIMVFLEKKFAFHKFLEF